MVSEPHDTLRDRFPGHWLSLVLDLKATYSPLSIFISRTSHKICVQQTGPSSNRNRKWHSDRWYPGTLPQMHMVWKHHNVPPFKRCCNKTPAPHLLFSLPYNKKNCNQGYSPNSIINRWPLCGRHLMSPDTLPEGTTYTTFPEQMGELRLDARGV
jgi:hypothetical protein